MGFLTRNKLNFRNNKKREVTQPITGTPDTSERISTRKLPKSSKRKASKASTSTAKSSCRRIPLNCLNPEDDASASQVDMVDLRPKTSPMHSTSTAKNSATKNPDSMMTPDMLEVLGLTELHKSYQFYPEKPKKKETAGNATSASHSLHPTKAVVLQTRRKRNVEASARARQRDTETSRKGQTTTRQSETTKQGQARQKQTPKREPTTTREAQTSTKKSVRYSETPSCLYYADNDAKSLTSACTSSTCSSDDEYYEPMSADPCDCDVYYPCQEDDWTFEGTNCYDRGTTTTTSKKKDSQESALSSFDPVSCVGMVLTMPIACGLLCIDNVLDTNYFESASESLKAAGSTSDKPEFLVIEEKKRSHRNKRANTPLMA